MSAFVPGWDFNGNRLCRMTEDGPIRALPFNVVPESVEVEETGRTQSIQVRVIYTSSARRDEHLSIPASVVSAASPALELAQTMDWHLLPKEARNLSNFLSAVIYEGGGIDRHTVIGKAQWRGDNLLVPVEKDQPASSRFPELAKYGGRANIDEEEAREKWRRVVEIALHYPKLAIVLGAPFASFYIVRVEAELFIIHVTGESSTGKSILSGAAIATVGNPGPTRPNLYRTWNMSEQAPTALLKQLGILPAWFDESGTDQREARALKALIFSLAQGIERLRAQQHGGLDDAGYWDCLVLSTGEARLSDIGVEQGLRKRVLEISAPLANLDSALEVRELAKQAYGWPIKWLVENPDPEGFAETFERYWRDPGETPGGTANIFPAVVEHVALCGAGFVRLADLVGVDARVAMSLATQEVSREAASNIAGEGLSVSERLHRAVYEDARTHPELYPEANSNGQEYLRERRGVRFDDGAVAILSRAGLERIAEDGLNVDDALRNLRDREKLEARTGRLTGRRVFYSLTGERTQQDAYIFLP